MSLPLKVAVVLNLPAVLVGMMPLHFVPNQERTIKQEFYAHLATSVLVAVLWFVVGLWLDRQLGFVVRRRCSRSLVRRVLRWSVLVIGRSLVLRSNPRHHMGSCPPGVEPRAAAYCGRVIVLAGLNGTRYAAQHSSGKKRSGNS